ncbi:MAG: L-amino acid N-acyltransferase YncA [Acidimicrobiales bacterium]|jgi:L-amino acid N-acyltransferase YncA
MAIYNREVLESTSTFDLVPRTLADQAEFIRVRSGGLTVVVAELPDGSAITGFASLSFYRDRPGYRTSVEDSVYVHADHQRSGVGRLLLESVIDEARLHGFHAIFARIIDSQEASMRLHLDLGFELVGTEREVGRKFGRWRDVALLQRLL